jgi:hypothetical protein
VDIDHCDIRGIDGTTTESFIGESEFCFLDRGAKCINGIRKRCDINSEREAHWCPPVVSKRDGKVCMFANAVLLSCPACMQPARSV